MKFRRRRYSFTISPMSASGRASASIAAFWPMEDAHSIVY